jgi:hypothetical protein
VVSLRFTTAYALSALQALNKALHVKPSFQLISGVHVRNRDYGWMLGATICVAAATPRRGPAPSTTAQHFGTDIFGFYTVSGRWESSEIKSWNRLICGDSFLNT